jgi:hypothetical protein
MGSTNVLPTGPQRLGPSPPAEAAKAVLYDRYSKAVNASAAGGLASLQVGLWRPGCGC